MTKLIIDGERSRLRVGLAKNLLRKLQEAGIPKKTVEIDGFRISMVAEPPTIKITAPLFGVVVICSQANHMRWFMSEGLGAPLVGHDFSYCITQDAEGNCIARQLISNVVYMWTQWGGQSPVVVDQGAMCVPYSAEPLIDEFVECVGQYYIGNASYVGLLDLAICFGQLRNSGFYLPAPAPIANDIFGPFLTIPVRHGLAVTVRQSNTLGNTNYMLLLFRATRNKSLVPVPFSFGLSAATFFSEFFTAQVSTLPLANANWVATSFVISEDADALILGVYFAVVEYDIGDSPNNGLYLSVSLVTFLITFGESPNIYTSQQWFLRRQPGVAEFDVQKYNYLGAPFSPVCNRIQFTDLDGASVVWGLLIPTHIAGSDNLKGSFKFDRAPASTTNTPYDFGDSFLQNGVGSYIFPPSIFLPLVRANYVRFKRSGTDIFFLVYQQLVARGLDCSVVEAYLGSPWQGWTPFVLPSGGVVRDVRLLRYELANTGELVLDALALLDGVDPATQQRQLQVRRLDTSVSSEWLDAGILQPDQVPADPALWRVAMYGAGTATYLHPDGRVPDMPQLPVFL